MASKTTLNAKNLEALGAEKLAELLIEISTGSAAHKRRLRMELAGNSSSAELAREVRKRLSSISRAKSWIDWKKIKAVKADLENQRKIIVDTIAPVDPNEAFDLLWHFMSLAVSIFERSDDGNGLLIASFHQAAEDFGRIADLANVDAALLVDKIFTALQGNGYGQYDRLIISMTSALGRDGLILLKQRFEKWSIEPSAKIPEEDQVIVGWSSRGPVYEHQVYTDSKSLTVQVALQEIADALGDVDLYIAQQPESSRQFPAVSAKIATRLLAAGRVNEALEVLDVTQLDGRHEIPSEWQQVRADVLETLGRVEEAQRFRWECFEQSLNGEQLRAFLRRLPDFDDIEAEEKAFGYVQEIPDANRALAFLLNYPSLSEAAKLVLRRSGELDGDHYVLMSQAAEVLTGKHPLAATVILRSMIEFTLKYARSTRYKHAARHLVECGSLVRYIDDFGTISTHDSYVADLRKVHGRKHGFWTLVDN